MSGKKICIVSVLLLSMLIIFSCSLSFAAEVEIVYPNVNYRKSPGGEVIHRFAGGEVLEAQEEVRQNDQLWYHLSSDEYGEGYVSAIYAKPVWQGQYVYDGGNPDDGSAGVTDNMLGFLEEWLELHFDYGFCYWNNEGGYRVYPELSEVERKEKSTPECKIHLADMLFRYGLIWETQDHAVLNDPEIPVTEKAAVASKILKNHYGTDDICLIIRSCYVIDIPASDWHYGNFYMYDADRRNCEAVLRRVEEKYGSSETLPGNEPMQPDPDLVLYYNPEGGSKYHVDQNCLSTSPQYLPFTGRFTWSEIHDDPYAGLMPCNVCGAPIK